MTHRAKIVSARFSQPVLIFLLAISCITSFSVTAQVIERNPFPWARNEKALLEQIAHEVPSSPQDNSLEYLGRWGWGRCYGVAAMGNYVFTGSGPTLLWLDVTDKRRPVVAWDTINNTSVIESYNDARGFAIQDSIGYAIMGDKLVIVDFRNPAAPAIIGELQLSRMAATLVVEGTFVYVVRAYGGLYIVDVSNPYSPYLRNFVVEPAEWPKLAITNHNLYIVDQINLETYYVDVSNPDSAHAIQMYLRPFTQSAYAKDSLLLLVDGGLHIYSIAVPSSPVRLSSSGIPGVRMRSITLKGDTAFLGAWDGKIAAIDISNRYNPVVVGTYIPPVLQHERTAYFVDVEDTSLYSANSFEMLTYAIADPSSMEVLSVFTMGEEFNKVILRNGVAYVMSGLAGLWAVDVSDPRRPRRVGHLRTAGYAYDIIIDSTVAYISLNDPWESVHEETWNGIWAVDISRPDSMRVLGTYMTSDPFNISKSGSLLFVTHGNDFAPLPDTTLTILDVSNPFNMQRVGCIVAGYNVREITSRDSIAFVAIGSGFGPAGLKIFDCRNPANPKLLSTTLTAARGVSVNGNFAYVHRGDSSFVINITDLTTPIIVGRVRNPGSGSFESIVTGNLVFWTNPGKFGTFDVSNPNQPRSLFVDARAPYGSGIDIAGDTIYVTDFYEGLRIFRYTAGPTSVEGGGYPIVETMRLFQNYPNPFNPKTVISFQLPVSSFATLKVYTLLGQEVATVVSEQLNPGSYTTTFDASGLPSGIYVYRLTTVLVQREMDFVG